MTQNDTERDIIEQVRAEIKGLNLSQSEAARQMGISPSTLTQLLNGSYAADPKNHLATLVKWLNMVSKSLQVPETPDWIQTQSAEKIMNALDYARMSAGMTLIYGGSGVGKTKACEAYREQYPNVWIVTMSPAKTSVSGVLEELALALGMKEIPWRAARIEREAVAILKDTQGLVVIDEAQHLDFQALDALRSVYDMAKIGFAFIGNEKAFTRMKSGKLAPYLDRLYGRISKRLYLPKVSKEDIEAVAKGFRTQDKDALKYLCEIGQKPGGLRVVVNVMQLATVIAGGAVPEMPHIEAAWRDLGL